MNITKNDSNLTHTRAMFKIIDAWPYCYKVKLLRGYVRKSNAVFHFALTHHTIVGSAQIEVYICNKLFATFNKNMSYNMAPFFHKTAFEVLQVHMYNQIVEQLNIPGFKYRFVATIEGPNFARNVMRGFQSR